MSARKRTRGAAGARVAKRPISKELLFVLKAGLAGTQATTTLYTATFPVTVVGLRWDLNAIQDAGTGGASTSWVIVTNRQGNTVGSIGNSDGGDFYTPQQNVIAFGYGTIDNNVDHLQWMGSTKAMRKLQGGDTLVFIALGAATNTSRIAGAIQFFVKA